MNFSQLTAYLQAYLETNDNAVIGQIPNFMTLAAARISTDLRSSLIERTEVIDALPSQPLPDGFLAATLLRMNTNIHGFVTPTLFNELAGTSAQCYTLLSGNIQINPAPVLGDVVELSYYVAGDEALSSRLPHLFLHGAAAEAELYQGNTADAQIELQLYQSDLQQANGWDINSGPISLGGASRAAPAPFTLNTTPIRAVDVTYSPAPGVFSTNVQAAITEVQGNLSSHTGDLTNPHQTTAFQVGAIAYVAPGNAGNILASDGTEWQSVDPSVAVSGVATFNGRTGAVNPIIQDYSEWFPNTPASVADNSVVLFDGTDGRLQKAGPLISALATDAELTAGLAPKADTATVNAQLALKADISSLGTAAAANITTSATDTTAGRVLQVGAFGAGAAAGTALWGNANLVKTTSATDTTAGSMLKVGDFGLGAGGSSPSVTDANAAVKTGFYNLATPFTNGPTATFYDITVVTYAASVTQIATLTGLPPTPRMYIRTYDGAVWGAWREVATSANSFGQGQTWQDVLGSRASNTTYTNSTGKPIAVSIRTGALAENCNITVAGVIVSATTSSATSAVALFAIVPNGATYSYTSGTVANIWTELR